MSRAHRSLPLRALALVPAAALALAGCSAGGTGAASGTTGSSSAGSAASAVTSASTASSSSTSSSSSAAGAASGGVLAGATVTDMSGTQVTLPSKVQSVVATDNRVFRTLDAWGVKLAAAPKAIMYKGDGGPSYRTDPSVVDLGSHREPNLEALVASHPDVVLNGQRFNDRKAEIDELTGDAAIVDTNFQAEQGKVDESLRRLTLLLGETTGHQADAQRLVADFDAAIAEAKAAYRKDDTVMGLIASGGKLSYVAPGTGRSIGPFFDMVGLTPALDQAGSTNHQGDDISVEAIVAAKPDVLIVMDRDAAIGQEGASVAELISGSEALKDVPAVKEGRIVTLPADFYLAEDIQNHTAVLKDLAKVLGTSR